MLVLKIVEGDHIVINGNIKVKFEKYSSGFRVAIDAPKSVSIQRSAVFEREKTTMPEQNSDITRK
jgi:sRNA-binding carbon storage regulator CsrA